MKNLSTGTGLCIAGLCAVVFPFAQKLASVDSQAHAGVQASAMTAVASSATAQVTPTIVWYDMAMSGSAQDWIVLARAWSDGRIEAKRMSPPGDWCNGVVGCIGTWQVVSDPNQGYSSIADLDVNGQVDGADLGTVLSAWGDAPRQDTPPSDCPLNLVNP